ncbi:MAG: hypothetical protein C0599_08145, partial [Salinivirgaceae bacterium]
MKSNVNKNIMRYLYLILIVLTISSTGFSQKIKIKIDKDKFETFKERWTLKKHIRKGKSAYKENTFASYIEAADHFRNAYEMVQDNAPLNFWLGMAYLKSKPKNWAERYIEKAYQADKTIHPKLIYYLAKAKHLNYKFDESITLMNEFKSTLTAEELGYMDEEIKKHLSECRYAKEYIADTARVFITRIDEINSKYDDFAPVIPPDGQKMYFTSKRPTEKKEEIYEATGQNVENIFWAGRRGREWNLNGNISKKINTKENNAVIGLSPNGMQLILFDGKANGGDILKTEYKNTKWRTPKDSEFGKINSSARESSATISYDNRALYFVSDRDDPNKIGGQDIYISTRAKSNKKWGKPLNAGGTLNSKYDEEGLFLHPSGQVIYFSSKGHTSMGGYDLFKSELQEDGTWGTPENLGYPINTPGDDLFFGITANGRYGYYSSRGRDGQDYDIFEIIFLGPEKPLIQSSEDLLIASLAEPITETVIEKSVEIKTIRLTIVKGKIYD